MYLSALWGPNQQGKKKQNCWKRAQDPQPASLPPPGSAILLLFSASHIALPSHLSFVSYAHLHFSLLKQGIKISLSGQCLTHAAVAKREKPFSNTAPSFLCANTALN